MHDYAGKADLSEGCWNPMVRKPDELLCYMFLLVFFGIDRAHTTNKSVGATSQEKRSVRTFNCSVDKQRIVHGRGPFPNKV